MKQITIVNLTEHEFRIRNEESEEIIELKTDLYYPPFDGPVPRVEAYQTVVEVINVGGYPIEVVRTEFGEIQNLPDPRPDTIFIVSTLAAQAAARIGRFDVRSPNTIKGKVIRYPDGHPRKGNVFAVKASLQSFA